MRQYNLFVDKNDYVANRYSHNMFWIIARSKEQAQEIMLLYGMPKLISLAQENKEILEWINLQTKMPTPEVIFHDNKEQK